MLHFYFFDMLHNSYDNKELDSAVTPTFNRMWSVMLGMRTVPPSIACDRLTTTSEWMSVPSRRNVRLFSTLPQNTATPMYILTVSLRQISENSVSLKTVQLRQTITIFWQTEIPASLRQISITALDGILIIIIIIIIIINVTYKAQILTSHKSATNVR